MSTAPLKSYGVPGDRLARCVVPPGRTQATLRLQPKTYVVDDHVMISSNDTTEALHAEAARQFHQAISSDDGDTSPIDDSGWRFHWSTWSTP